MANPKKMKQCKRCSRYKYRGEFYRSKTSKDGLYSWCTECYKARSHARSLDSLAATAEWSVGEWEKDVAAARKRRWRARRKLETEYYGKPLTHAERQDTLERQARVQQVALDTIARSEARELTYYGRPLTAQERYNLRGWAKCFKGQKGYYPTFTQRAAHLMATNVITLPLAPQEEPTP